MAEEKAYTIIVTRTAEVEVFAENWDDAERYVKDIVDSGDSCADPDDPTYSHGCIRELDETGNPIEDDK